MDEISGIQRIEAAFNQAKHENRIALMPYYSLGYPTPYQSLEIVEAIARAGADIIELGIPFSDPLADGPTIQHSMQVALSQGITVKACFEMVRILRERGIDHPILLMGYINPILAYGLNKFIDEAAVVKADGFIIPDLPLEESAVVEQQCHSKGLALVYLLPPTAEEERAQKIVSHSSGFVYIVSVSGVTGERKSLPPSLHSFVRKVRKLTSLPLAIGFGISRPEHVQDIGKIADGVIVGSALINKIDGTSEPLVAVKEFISQLRSACERTPSSL